VCHGVRSTPDALCAGSLGLILPTVFLHEWVGNAAHNNSLCRNEPEAGEDSTHGPTEKKFRRGNRMTSAYL